MFRPLLLHIQGELYNMLKTIVTLPQHLQEVEVTIFSTNKREKTFTQRPLQF
jgi:hypothetical protein